MEFGRPQQAGTDVCITGYSWNPNGSKRGKASPRAARPMCQWKRLPRPLGSLCVFGSTRRWKTELVAVAGHDRSLGKRQRPRWLMSSRRLRVITRGLRHSLATGCEQPSCGPSPCSCDSELQRRLRSLSPWPRASSRSGRGQGVGQDEGPAPEMRGGDI